MEIENGSRISYKFRNLQTIDSVHIVFDSDLERETLPGHWTYGKRDMRANVILDSPQMYVPKTLCKEFYVEVETEDGVEQVLKIVTNRKRTHHLILKRTVKRITLVPVANWGDSDYTKVISFDFR